MGGTQFETSPNMNMVGIMLQLTRALWSTGYGVVIDIGFCVIRGLLEMRKRGVYESALIKKGALGLKEFMEMLLMSTSG